MPPSTMWVAPVMKPASSERRNAHSEAISSGVPTRPTACWALSWADYAASVVAIQPGWMQFARHSGPMLIASAWVSAAIPPLLAA